MNDRSSVSIDLDKDEALVLFDLLAREVDDRDGAALRPAVEHDGELWALNALHTALERTLTGPFDAAYKEHVGSARAALVVRAGGLWRS